MINSNGPIFRFGIIIDENVKVVMSIPRTNTIFSLLCIFAMNELHLHIYYMYSYWIDSIANNGARICSVNMYINDCNHSS